MPGDPRIRASDADRDRTAACLREHHAAGRLTGDEFNERLDATYSAKTVGELDQLLTDLPAIDLYELPDASLRRSRRGGPPVSFFAGGGEVTHVSAVRLATWVPGLAVSLTVSLTAFLIWLATGDPGSLWFLLVVVPTAVFMIGRRLGGGGRG